jgi:hypothetical protein
VDDGTGQVYRDSKKEEDGEMKPHALSAEQQDIALSIFGRPVNFQDLGMDDDDSEDEMADEYIGEDGEVHKVAVDRLELARAHFEPSVIEERFLTDADEMIRTQDVPERLQLWHKGAGRPPVPEPESKERVHEEAVWIVARAFKARPDPPLQLPA